MTAFFQRLSLFVRSAGTTFIPRLIPLLYAALAGLTVQGGASNFQLAVVTRAGAVFGACMLWFLDGYLDKWFAKKIKKYKHKKKKGKLGKRMYGLYKKIELDTRPGYLMLLVLATTRSAIPDILIIRAVHQKLPFWMFLIAAMVGKIFVYTPLIYGIEFSKVFIEWFS